MAGIRSNNKCSYYDCTQAVILCCAKTGIFGTSAKILAKISYEKE